MKQHVPPVKIVAVLLFIYLLWPVLSSETKIKKEPLRIKGAIENIDGRPPQFVIFSFDGAKSLAVWQQTLSFAEELRRKGIDISFTYFLSGAYLLDSTTKDMYEPPQHEKGRSLIGFSDSSEDVKTRLNFLHRALGEGHEVGSHAVGHFDGSIWSYEDWKKEFAMFDKIIEQTKLKKGLKGFRAPSLAISDGMYKALKDSGFRYDASRIASPKKWPTKDAHGLWEFPLNTIYLHGQPTISMDYSIFALQTNAEEKAEKGSELWNQIFNDTYDAYMQYFTNSYKGNRVPVSIGHHFAEWNQGVYWEVMKKVAEEVCGKTEVRCVTYTELADYLDAQTADAIAGYERGEFNKMQ